MVNYYNSEYFIATVSGHPLGPMEKQLTACEVESLELSDYEQLTAVLLEGQVAKPLEDLWHLLGASVGKKSRRGSCETGTLLLI